MALGELGACLLVLLAITIFGNLWFHLVESLLRRIKNLFRRQEPPPWHPLPQEDEDR